MFTRVVYAYVDPFWIWGCEMSVLGHSVRDDIVVVVVFVIDVTCGEAVEKKMADEVEEGEMEVRMKMKRVDEMNEKKRRVFL